MWGKKITVFKTWDALKWRRYTNQCNEFMGKIFSILFLQESVQTTRQSLINYHQLSTTRSKTRRWKAPLKLSTSYLLITTYSPHSDFLIDFFFFLLFLNFTEVKSLSICYFVSGWCTQYFLCRVHTHCWVLL